MRKMGKKRRGVLPLGSISEGTHKIVDLLRAFLTVADSISLRRDERFKVQAIRKRFNGVDEYVGITDDHDEMVLILEDHAPDYATVGFSLMDGADFGVWPDWEMINQELGYTIRRGDTLPSKVGPDTTHFLLVNDHGNATLYRRAARRWVEIWAVV